MRSTASLFESNKKVSHQEERQYSLLINRILLKPHLIDAVKYFCKRNIVSGKKLRSSPRVWSCTFKFGVLDNVCKTP